MDKQDILNMVESFLDRIVQHQKDGNFGLSEDVDEMSIYYIDLD